MDSVKMGTSMPVGTNPVNTRQDLPAKESLELAGDQVSLGSGPTPDNRMKELAEKSHSQSVEKTLEKGFTVINGGLIGLFAGALVGSLLAGPAGPVLATLASAGFGSMGMLLGGMIAGLRVAGKD
jgi:hypothetical protein